MTTTDNKKKKRDESKWQPGEFEAETAKLNKKMAENPEPLIKWLQDAEQIPED